MNLEISAAYDPIDLSYTVTVGKNSVEIPGHTLTQKHVEEFNQELEKLNDYYTYEWQDMREIRANALLNHYVKQFLQCSIKALCPLRQKLLKKL